jgi:hypothetical protein
MRLRATDRGGDLLDPSVERGLLITRGDPTERTGPDDRLATINPSVLVSRNMAQRFARNLGDLVERCAVDLRGGVGLNDYRLTPVGSLFECNSRY